MFITVRKPRTSGREERVCVYRVNWKDKELEWAIKPGNPIESRQRMINKKKGRRRSRAGGMKIEREVPLGYCRAGGGVRVGIGSRCAREIDRKVRVSSTIREKERGRYAIDAGGKERGEEQV